MSTMTEFWNLSLWISIIALVTSAIIAWLYLRISESQIDDNIINVTVSIYLTLLEKAKTLQPRERRLLADWLNDWEYFAPALYQEARQRETRNHREPKKYFNELAAGDT